ncbi:MAG: DUF1365 domain-containing protein [Pseudomonadota bacterium]
MHSALYEGTVRHRRLAPRAHAFHYRLSLLWLDLAELDTVFQDRLLWSTGKPNLVWWRRQDYLGDPAVSLDTAVRDLVESRTGHRPAGPVRLLTHPRYFGYGFNPVSFYFCYGSGEEVLEAILAEVTNTPWKERHVYVLDARANQASPGAPDNPSRFLFSQDKAFHVSPFLPMGLEYRFRFTRPGQRLTVHMADLEQGQVVFDASLSLARRPLNGSNLARALVRFPFMTGQVIFGIYWQALRLWLKGLPVFDHPAARPATHAMTPKP